MVAQTDQTTTTLPTLDQIGAVMDESFSRLSTLLDRFALALDAGPDAGGWTARQALSHVVGAWQRAPIHAAFYLDGDPAVDVPIELHDPYWITGWETAPLASFALAIRAGYEGNKAFLRNLDPAALSTVRTTPFGPLPLAHLLMLSYGGHLTDFHIPQLEAFVQMPGDKSPG